MVHQIEIAYASVEPKLQILLSLSVKPKTTVLEALEASQILKLCPEIGCELVQELQGRISIFGEMVNLDTELKPSDRIVILRPLLSDPKDLRKKRAKAELRAKVRQREDKNKLKKALKQKHKKTC